MRYVAGGCELRSKNFKKSIVVERYKIEVVACQTLLKRGQYKTPHSSSQGFLETDSILFKICELLLVISITDTQC